MAWEWDCDVLEVDCVALEVGELLEFELEEADSIGLLTAVRVTAQGGAPV